MSKNLQIVNELENIDSATFQLVCDGILYYYEKDYPNLFRTGSQPGKRKTIKGTPDAYFVSVDGKFLMVECTTKSYKDRKAFIKKALSDITKCLTPTKTGAALDKIEKIIFCCNADIKPEDYVIIQDYCSDRNVKIEIKGIHTLAAMLCERAKSIAKDFLSISIDTRQILSPETFTEEYARSGFATDLNNRFFYRQQELAEIYDSVNSNSLITILTGEPGVGKSKLAIETFKQLKKSDPDFETLCISNKDASIHDDLRIYIFDHKNYLILVDDANRQSAYLESLVNLLREKRVGKLHIVITVREYALQQIVDICKNYKPNIIRILKFNTWQLEDVLRNYDALLPSHQINQILTLAKGNARLGLMAAKVASSNYENEIQDVYQIYHDYSIFHEYISFRLPGENAKLFIDNCEFKKGFGIANSTEKSVNYSVYMLRSTAASKMKFLSYKDKTKIELDNCSLDGVCISGIFKNITLFMTNISLLDIEHSKCKNFNVQNCNIKQYSFLNFQAKEVDYDTEDLAISDKKRFILKDGQTFKQASELYHRLVLKSAKSIRASTNVNFQLTKATSSGVAVLFGYFYKPIWIIGWIIGFVTLYALLYTFFLPNTFPESMFFSCYTFLTIGFGDLPNGKVSTVKTILVFSEGLLGVFYTAALLVSVINSTKKQ